MLVFCLFACFVVHSRSSFTVTCNQAEFQHHSHRFSYMVHSLKLALIQSLTELCAAGKSLAGGISQSDWLLNSRVVEYYLKGQKIGTIFSFKPLSFLNFYSLGTKYYRLNLLTPVRGTLCQSLGTNNCRFSPDVLKQFKFTRGRTGSPSPLAEAFS